MNDLRELYQQVILDHNKNPRNYREMPNATSKIEGYNPLCGDHYTVFLNVDNDVIKDISFTGNGDEKDVRSRLNAPAKNATQDLYVSGALKTGRVMVKDEDVCLHCGLCAERCPTGAWDMQRFLLDMPLAHGKGSCRQ